MKKIINILFSMQTMGTLILIFAFSVGTATFIENDFGTTAAKAVVYNSTWFNILLIVLAINLIGRMIIGKMYSKKKITVFMFHFSFLIILIGAGITRFISYEGIMHIREGASSNIMISDNTYVDIKLTDGNNTKSLNNKVFMSKLTPKAYSSSATIGNKDFSFSSVKYVPNASEVITDSKSGGNPYIALVFSNGGPRQTYNVKYGSIENLSGVALNFSDTFKEDAVNIKIAEGALNIYSNYPIITMSMATSEIDTLSAAEWHPFENRRLYTINGNNIVLTNFYLNGKIDYESNKGNVNVMDALYVDVSDGTSVKQIILRGGKGYEGKTQRFSMGDVNVEMTYGAKGIELPFSIKLVDFELDRYAGSMSPSSYASDVVLIDQKNNVNFDYRIFMNHVLNYDGYRFFQSSYDADEAGTILSVAHDYWGSFFTYLGYFLLSLGMMLSIISRNTRFAVLGRQLKKFSKKNNGIAAILLFVMMSISLTGFSQHSNIEASETSIVPIDVASKFGELLMQSNDGRLKPVNTFTDEVIRKVNRSNKIDGLTSDQIVLGMMTYPHDWQRVAMIKVTHPELKKILGIYGKYATYMDFITSEGNYKLRQQISSAYAKGPSMRNKLDNDIIKVDERLNICFMIYRGDMLKILPDPFNSHKTWYSPVSDVIGMPQEDSAFIKAVVPAMLSSISNGNSSQAKELISGIYDYQKKFGADIWPSEEKIKAEMMYNKLQIFSNLSKLYGLIGILLIILLFVDMFKSSKALRFAIKFLITMVAIGFVFQTFGLGLRWYISGHAPWSDGYESMIYVAWVTMLAGLIFSRGSKMTVAATTILSSIILMVAHLSWMDPQVTNLVPVLKSYWLTIHVSVITASYGFLALSAILGLINLLLMIAKTSSNHIKFDLKISELTAINQRASIVGLYLLTIGMFLGGVWANESWGRYWGWDPKETWALVSVLVYSFVAHMHFMPGLKSKFAFNFATLISYGVILMTFLGVNYYLSGLHSYATGDPVPVPMGVYYSIATIAVIAILAKLNNNKNSVTK